MAESLKKLREQINFAFPKRSKISDGSIGDARHSARKSDHNPNEKGVVCAVDITHDPAAGVDCHKLAGALARSRDPRIKYLIWNRQILSSTQNPWTWRPYYGTNGHTKHIHISVNSRYDDATGWDIDFKDCKEISQPPADLLELGDRGFGVTGLQEKLHKAGILQKNEVDGIFGEKTEKAVRIFQANNGLTVDGIAGPNTLRKLEETVK